MSPRMILSSCLVALFVLASAAPALADRKDELADRFARRAAEVRDLKDDGKIGETTRGLLAAVKSDSGAASVIAAENADRSELYDIIAKEQKTTADLVAARAARRNFENARPGDWLQTAGGEWKQKR